jgi:hypothetical protein
MAPRQTMEMKIIVNIDKHPGVGLGPRASGLGLRIRIRT